MAKKEPSQSVDRLAKARLIYVTGYTSKEGRVFPSLKWISRELHIPLDVLKKAASREGWHRERMATYEEYYQSLKEQVLRELQEQSIDFRKTIVEGARLGIDLIKQRLHLMQEDFQKSPSHSKVRGYEIRDLGAALEAFRRIGQEALGDKLTETYTWKDILTQARDQKYPRRSPLRRLSPDKKIPSDQRAILKEGRSEE